MRRRVLTIGSLTVAMIAAAAVLPGPAGWAEARHFVGLEDPPPLDLLEPGGLEVVLHAANAEGLRPGVPIYYRRVEIGGSVRRGCETIGDLDLLCESNDGRKVVKAFTGLPQVKKVLADGTTKGSVLVERRDGIDIQVDCRVVPAKSFGAALQYFTGSKEHNVRLREIAVRK